MLKQIFSGKFQTFKLHQYFSSTNQKVVIIGGGVGGGGSCAARLRRLNEKADITIYEMGSYVSYSNCGLPYYLGNLVKKPDQLVFNKAEHFKALLNINVRNHCEVKSIDRKSKSLVIYDHNSKKQFTDSYDKLVLSPGSQPFIPPIKGINKRKNRIVALKSIPDAIFIKKQLQNLKIKHALIVGSGFSGTEMADCLNNIGIAITIVNQFNQIFPTLDFEMAAIVHAYFKYKNIQLYLSDQAERFDEQETHVTTYLRSGKTIKSDIVFLCLGTQPQSKLARQCNLKVERGIVVNNKLETSDSDIYALGDAIQINDLVNNQPTIIPLAGLAIKQGRLVADQICGRSQSMFKGALGTIITKIFDLTIAAAGNNSRTLEALRIPYLCVWSHQQNHDPFYPKSKRISYKLMFCPNTGLILGAQIVGCEGVDKRIEVLATAIKQKMTVFDLQELELTYSPPFDNFKNSVNQLASIAVNALEGLVRFCTWKDIDWHLKNGSFLLDVRSKSEFSMAHIPNSVNIPLEQIREKMCSLPKDKHIVLICAYGLRAYQVYRILVQSGFRDISVLGGGFLTWHFPNSNPQSNENIFELTFEQNFYNKPVPSKILNTPYAFCDTKYLKYCPRIK